MEYIADKICKERLAVKRNLISLTNTQITSVNVDVANEAAYNLLENEVRITESLKMFDIDLILFDVKMHRSFL